MQEPAKEDLDKKVLYLDEPLNNLDLHYQYSLMWQARTKIVDKGGIVVAVLHDINMAYQFADRILILKDGNLVVDDATEKAMDPKVLSSIFDIEVTRINTPEQEVFFNTRPSRPVQSNEFINPIPEKTGK